MENTGGIGNYCNSKVRRPPVYRGKVKKEMRKLIADEVTAATSMAAQWMRRKCASCCGIGNYSNSKARFQPKRDSVKEEMGKLIADEVTAATSMAAQWTTRKCASCCRNSAIAPSPSSEEDNSKP